MHEGNGRCFTKCPPTMQALLPSPRAQPLGNNEACTGMRADTHDEITLWNPLRRLSASAYDMRRPGFCVCGAARIVLFLAAACADSGSATMPLHQLAGFHGQITQRLLLFSQCGKQHICRCRDEGGLQAPASSEHDWLVRGIRAWDQAIPGLSQPLVHVGGPKSVPMVHLRGGSCEPRSIDRTENPFNNQASTSQKSGGGGTAGSAEAWGPLAPKKHGTQQQA